MIVVLGAPGARLDAGAVALWLAHVWCSQEGHSGSDAMVLIDADPAGTRLAERFGAISEGAYSPAARGLPTLMAAREHVTLRLLAEHCYRLDASPGSLWALFAPFHPRGGRLACEWLSRRVEPLAAIDRQRPVLVASTLTEAARSLGPLAKSAASAVVVAAVDGAADAGSLNRLCSEAGLSEVAPERRLLVIEGVGSSDADEIGSAAGMRVMGRVPVVDDASVLRRRVGRRDRRLPAVLADVVELLRKQRRVPLPELPAPTLALAEPLFPELLPPSGIDEASPIDDRGDAEQRVAYGGGE